MGSSLIAERSGAGAAGEYLVCGCCFETSFSTARTTRTHRHRYNKITRRL